MSRKRISLGTAAIVLACALTGTLMAAGPASAASRGFKIYNLSSHPLRLVSVEDINYCGDSCGNNFPMEFEGRPPDGSLLMPGARPHDWELKYYNYNARLTYDLVGTQEVYRVWMRTELFTNDSKCSITVGNCTAGGLTLTVTDPPGTVHDIPADKAQAQATTLRDLCKKTSLATCKFKPKKEEKTSAPAHLVGDPVNNCDDEVNEYRVTRENKVGSSTSVGVEFGVEAETNFIFEKAKVSVTTKYEHEWTNEVTFKQDLTLHVKPGDMVWVTATAPIYRDTGDFVLKLGNTTWTLRDVYFDTPDPNRTGEFVIDHRALTPEEYKVKCPHKLPPGSHGLTRAPASWVSILQSGSGGHDTMIGGRESNTLRGLAGNDLLRGGAGNDTLDGGTGNDTLQGGPGRDTLNGGPGADTIIDKSGPTLVRTGTNTGPGRDFVDVRDGRGDDTVICGSPRSTVVVDAGDRLIGRCGAVLRASGAPRAPRTAADAAVKRGLDGLVAAHGGPPGAIATLYRGDRLTVLSAGLADTTRRGAPRASDYMRIASVAKAFSAAVTLHLVQHGRLGLGDTIGERLPGLPAAWASITVREMLNHTSGLPDYTKSNGFAKQVSSDPHGYVAPSTIIDWVRADPLAFSPGSRYEYSNTDNIVIGLIAQAVTGRPYGQLLASIVFGPARLRHTTFPTTIALPNPFVHGYLAEPGAKPRDVSTFLSPSGAWASGAIVSTPADLGAFIRGDLGRRFFGAAQQRAQLQFVPGASSPAGPGINAAGLGIFRYRTRCGTVYGHTGNFPGYTQWAAATADGKRSITTTLNIPAPKGALLQRLRSVQTSAVCALLGR